MRQRALPQHAIARLANHPDKHFADEQRLDEPSSAPRLPGHQEHSLDPPRLATEGALWGAIKAHGLLPDTVILSDDAGQFEVARHALCWVHAERLVHKLDTFCDLHRKAQNARPFADLAVLSRSQGLQAEPSRRRKAQMKARFDRIFKRRTGFAMLDRLLKRLHANKAELLAVLDRPEIPLHTNGSENDIRCQVTKRKISGGTRKRSRPRLSRCLSRPRPRPVTNSASPSGTISAQGSKSPISPVVPPLPSLVRLRCAAPDGPDFCASYIVPSCRYRLLPGSGRIGSSSLKRQNRLRECSSRRPIGIESLLSQTECRFPIPSRSSHGSDRTRRDP